MRYAVLEKKLEEFFAITFSRIAYTEQYLMMKNSNLF